MGDGPSSKVSATTFSPSRYGDPGTVSRLSMPAGGLYTGLFRRLLFTQASLTGRAVSFAYALGSPWARTAPARVIVSWVR